MSLKEDKGQMSPEDKKKANYGDLNQGDKLVGAKQTGVTYKK